MLELMGFRLPKRQVRRGDSTVLGTYLFSSRTVQVLRTSDEHIEWTCDCERFRRQGRLETPLWCKHIAKAAARRSLERLTRRRAGVQASAEVALRGSVPAPSEIRRPRVDAHRPTPSGRLPPSKIAADDFVTPQ